MNPDGSLFAEVRKRCAGIFSALIFVCAAGSCVGTIAGFLGNAWWPFELTSPFRFQYAVALSLIAIGFGTGRKWKLALPLFIGALVNWWCVSSAYPIDPSGKPARGACLRLVLSNVLSANTEHRLLKEYIHGTAPDVVVLQEVNAFWLESLKNLSNAYPYIVANPRDDNFGIALLSRSPLTNTAVMFIGDAEVPSIIATVSLEGRPLTILATHPIPPGGPENIQLRNQQLAQIPRSLPTNGSPVVLVGDLNSTPWCSVFQKLVKESGLRAAAPSRGLYASWPAGLLPLRIPLDHCLLSPHLIITRREVGPNIGSDHFPVLFEVGWRE